MAFTQQTTASIPDFFTKLNTFLGANGWSTHLDTVAGEFAAWKNPSGSIWVTFAAQWDTSSPRNVGIYQWHGQAYDTTGVTGNVPYDQDDDSGNGAASTSNSALDDQRNVDFGSGGTDVEEMWVFEDTNYFHCVIRRNTNVYEHFGAGYLIKTNDWVGGEYCYGHRRDGVYNNGRGILQGSAIILLDGGAYDDPVSGSSNHEERVATLHVEGLDEQTTEKWAVIMAANQSSSNLGTARNGDARVHVLGGYRDSFMPQALGAFAGTIQRGLVPLTPILVGYFDRSTGNIRWPLGEMPDVRQLNIGQFADEQEVTIGSDTWVVFPACQRGLATGGSRNLGVAYKQVT